MPLYAKYINNELVLLWHILLKSGQYGVKPSINISKNHIFILFSGQSSSLKKL